MKRFFEEARRLIRMNSVSGNGNEEVANYVAVLMQDRGLKVQLQHVTHSDEQLSKRQFNVVGILGDSLVDRKIRKGLLLSSHLDTASPGLIENWTETGGDPFCATLREGKVFGLGAADSKLDFLCKLHAIEKFREKKLKSPIYIAGTCAEEQGMLGVKYLIKSLCLNPKAVLVGEPSDLKMVYAHKSFSTYKVSFGYQLVEKDARGFNRRIDLHSYGRAAHSSSPASGENAIEKAVQFLKETQEKGFELQFIKMEGGDTSCKVPDYAFFQFYLHSNQIEEFKEYFRGKLAQSEGRTFKAEFGGIGDSGVRFLSAHLFECVTETISFFKKLTAEIGQTTDVMYSPQGATSNVGRIAQKPGGLEMILDLRLLPESSIPDLELKVKKGIQEIASRYSKLNIMVSRARYNPPLQVSLEDEFLRVCRDAMVSSGIEPSFGRLSTSTEASQYCEKGYPVAVFGPGVSQSNSHSPNEWNSIEQLEKAMSFYEHVIEKVCL